MHPALSIYNVFNVILKHSMLLLKYRSEIELLNGDILCVPAVIQIFPPISDPCLMKITNEIAARNGQMDEMV